MQTDKGSRRNGNKIGHIRTERNRKISKQFNRFDTTIDTTRKKFVDDLKPIFSPSIHEDQIKVIRDVFESIKVWNNDNTIIFPTINHDYPLELLFKYLFDCIGILKKADSCVITEFGNLGTHGIIEYEPYSESTEKGNKTDLEWIQRVSDTKLRQAILVTFSFIISRHDMDVLGFGDDRFCIMDYIQEQLGNGVEDYESQEQYNINYLWMNEHTNNGSISNVIRSMVMLKCTKEQCIVFINKIKRLYPDWYKLLIDAMDIFSSELNLNRFCIDTEDPDGYSGHPLHIIDVVGFYWHEKDMLFQTHDEFIKQDYNEFGYCNPLNFAIHNTEFSQKLMPKTDWPIKVYEWFSHCNNLISETNKKICKPLCQTNYMTISSHQQLLPSSEITKEIIMLKSIL